MAENMKQGGMPEQIIPRRDIKPLADEIEAMLAEAGQSSAGGEKPPEGEPEMGEEAPAAGGVQAMADMLGVSVEKAQQLLDAAMMMPKMAGKSPEEIGQMLASDMNLRMQVEKNIGASEDGMARKKMVEGQMGPKSEPVPMEPTPAGSTK
jgi:hypothetical protein